MLTELLTIIHSNKTNYNKIQAILNLPNLDHKLIVTFALHCAKSCKQNINQKEYPDLHLKAAKCRTLVKAWLAGENVSDEELKAAANSVYSAASAYSAAYSVAYSARSASNSAYSAYNAAYSASAVYSAYSAAHSAAYSTAYGAANSAVYNTSINNNLKHLISLISKQYNYQEVNLL